MPSLRIFLNLDNLADLPAGSVFFAGHPDPASALAPAARDARLVADGFEGVQLIAPARGPAETSLPYCGLARVNRPEEADALLGRHADRGDRCVTLHVGWGLEDDTETDRLVAAVLAASARHRLPACIETHRATITQDMWRTVQLARRFPELRFNLDLSHYYCGQEMVYGDWEQKLAFLQPLFDRVAFIHGRIAAPGWMQAAIEDLESRPRCASGKDYLAHFRELWTRSMLGFLRHAPAHAELIFAPELLRPGNYYARTFPDASGCFVEECDRYAQALLYRDLARVCWAEAERRLGRSAPV